MRRLLLLVFLLAAAPGARGEVGTPESPTLLPVGWTAAGEGVAVMDPEQPRRAMLLWGSAPGATKADLTAVLSAREVEVGRGFAPAELDGVFRLATEALRGVAVASPGRGSTTRWAVVIVGDPELPRGFMDAAALALLRLGGPARDRITELPAPPTAAEAAARLGMPADAAPLGPSPSRWGRPFEKEAEARLHSKLQFMKLEPPRIVPAARRLLKSDPHAWRIGNYDPLAALCEHGRCAEALDFVRAAGTREAAARLLCESARRDLPQDLLADLAIYALGDRATFHGTPHCSGSVVAWLIKAGHLAAAVEIVRRDDVGSSARRAVRAFETRVPPHPLTLGHRWDPVAGLAEARERSEDTAYVLVGDGSSDEARWARWAFERVADLCESAPEDSPARGELGERLLLSGWRLGAWDAVDRAAAACGTRALDDRRVGEFMAAHLLTGRSPANKYLDGRARLKPTPRLVEYARVRASALSMDPGFRAQAVASALATIARYRNTPQPYRLLGELGEFRVAGDALLDKIDGGEETPSPRARAWTAEQVRWLRKCLVHGKVRDVQPLLYTEARLRKQVLEEGVPKGYERIRVAAGMAALGDTMWAFELPDDAILAWRIAKEHGVTKVDAKAARQTSWEAAAEEAERRRLQAEREQREAERLRREHETSAALHAELETPTHRADLTQTTYPCSFGRCYTTLDRCERLVTALEAGSTSPVEEVAAAEWACIQARPRDDDLVSFRAKRAKSVVRLYAVACGLSKSTEVDRAYCRLLKTWEAEEEEAADRRLAKALRDVAAALRALGRTGESGGGGDSYEPPSRESTSPDTVVRSERTEHCEWTPSEDPNMCLELGLMSCPVSPERRGALNDIVSRDRGNRGGYNCCFRCRHDHYADGRVEGWP